MSSRKSYWTIAERGLSTKSYSAERSSKWNLKEFCWTNTCYQSTWRSAPVAIWKKYLCQSNHRSKFSSLLFLPKKLKDKLTILLNSCKARAKESRLCGKSTLITHEDINLKPLRKNRTDCMKSWAGSKQSTSVILEQFTFFQGYCKFAENITIMSCSNMFWWRLCRCYTVWQILVWDLCPLSLKLSSIWFLSSIMLEDSISKTVPNSKILSTSKQTILGKVSNAMRKWKTQRCTKMPFLRFLELSTTAKDLWSWNYMRGDCIVFRKCIAIFWNS